jgi:hypothetical protein
MGLRVKSKEDHGMVVGQVSREGQFTLEDKKGRWNMLVFIVIGIKSAQFAAPSTCVGRSIFELKNPGAGIHNLEGIREKTNSMK